MICLHSGTQELCSALLCEQNVKAHTCVRLSGPGVPQHPHSWALQPFIICCNGCKHLWLSPEQRGGAGPGAVLLHEHKCERRALLVQDLLLHLRLKNCPATGAAWGALREGGLHPWPLPRHRAQPGVPSPSVQTWAFKNALRAHLRKNNQSKQPTSLHSWSLITHVGHKIRRSR